MQSVLITQATREERIKKAKELSEAQSSPFDQTILDTSEERGIASVKNLLNQVSRKPFNSKVTTAIIFEANRLTEEAQNALLKTLEEPTESLQIILTAPSRESILPTVASRCQEERLGNSETRDGKDRIEVKKFSKKLEEIEKKGLEEEIYYWDSIFTKAATDESRDPQSLKKLHRYNKTLLKLKKAEKLSVNKKLLSLIAALEAPEKP
ncbi:MAG TPA: hypothetical protein VLE47_02435 [Candidatus Saccharimonadales bacterium]|nr:hypothetical protein [Candidatus Saccharimonadales bacterium]